MPDFLFDIGKVLLDFDFESSLSKLATKSHTGIDSALTRLIERKDEFETGRISVSDYTKWAIETLDSNVTSSEFHRAWRDIFTPNLPMWEAVKQLNASGNRLILFSNTNAIQCPWIFEKFPDFSLFHGSVLSYMVDSIKPEPEIYQHAIDKYSLIPENTLYIDDLAANIATGEKFGFLTHQYDLSNHPAFEKWLSDKLNPET